MSRSKDSLLTLAQTPKAYLVPKHFHCQEIKRALTNFSVKILILCNYPIKIHQVDVLRRLPSCDLAIWQDTELF